MESTPNHDPQAPREAPAKARRRRRTAAVVEHVRYFLPKSGSSSERPELGQEAAGEAEVLVEAFRSTQIFYTVVAWSAIPETSGNQAKITKRPLARE